MIDECDYYILIIGGRYGSIESVSGKSYTQKEFEYASEIGVPIISFVHTDTSKLISSKVESSQDGKEKLEVFKTNVKTKLCKLWDSPSDLISQVILSLHSQIKSKPRVGWIRADLASSEEANKKIISLQKENDELKTIIEKNRTKAPIGTEKLQQGDDMYTIHFSYEKKNTYTRKSIQFDCSWNDIFRALSPLMLDETSEIDLLAEINRFIFIEAPNQLHLPQLENSIKIDYEDYKTIVVQFVALGLIKTSDKKKNAGNTNVYWSLTPFGHTMMIQLRALRK